MGTAATARRHTVRLHFCAGLDGHQIPDANLKILRDERIVLELERTGPSLYLSLAPGCYVAEAQYQGIIRRRTLYFGEAGGIVAFFHFPA